MEIRRFWLVWVEGKPGPVKKHYEREVAVQEAQRLCTKEASVACVLELVEAYTPVTEKLEIRTGEEVDG